MTVEEIYSRISEHMVNGIMFHEQMANYYDFLGLQGYKRCHEYHYMKEVCGYRGLCRYFVNHHNRLIPEVTPSGESVIPNAWYQRKRDDVDTNTKRKSVQNGLERWVAWEQDTKRLYEEMYKELIDIGEVASAAKIKELVCDADCELKKAERYRLNKKAVDYGISDIVAEQRPMHHKYRKKMHKEIQVKIC